MKGQGGRMRPALQKQGRAAARRELREPRGARVRDDDPEHRAAQRQQHAFGEQLPHEPSESGAQRGADRQLVPARGRSRREQHREVHARDREDGDVMHSSTHSAVSNCARVLPNRSRPAAARAVRGETSPPLSRTA